MSQHGCRPSNETPFSAARKPSACPLPTGHKRARARGRKNQPSDNPRAQRVPRPGTTNCLCIVLLFLQEEVYVRKWKLR